MEYGFEDDDIIPSAIAHSESTISQLRLQYEESKKNQCILEARLADFVKTCTCKATQCYVNSATQISAPTAPTSDRASQSERHFPESDDRFYQRVDEIVEQNKTLNANIFTLQKQLQDMDTERHVLESDLKLKHSQSIEKLKILQGKQESAYHDRIQKLERERTENLYTLEGSNGLSALRDDDSILHEGEGLVEKLESMMGTWKENMTNIHENKGSPNAINKIKFEKDSALKKCLRLDTQLSAFKKSKENLLNQVKTQEEELSSLRLFYNLHGSLSQEASLRDQYNEKVTELSERLKHRETELLASQRENDTLAAMIKRLERKVDAAQGGGLTNGLSGLSGLSPMLESPRTPRSRTSNKRFSSSNSSINSPIL